MSRFLFVSLPMPGHVHPISAVAAELAGRGHDVAWAGSESFLRPLVGADTQIYPIPLRAHRGMAERGMAATKSRWEGYIVPHARSTRGGIDSAVTDFAPDVLVVDQHAIAGAVIAHRHDLVWASVAPTTMELTRPLRVMPRVEEWIGAQMQAIWTAAGMPGEPPGDLRFSPHLVVAFTSAALTGDDDLPDNAVLVGPVIGERPADETFPWEWIDARRRTVLVTMGTNAMDLATDFYDRIVEALRPLADRVQAIIVAPPGAIEDPPEHLLVRPRVPVLDLLPHVSAVVSHGGLNTVCESLAHGVPLLIAPIKGDQPINASQVAALGAGVRVSFDHAGPAALRSALESLLDEPAYRAAAGRVRSSFQAAGGVSAAADALQTLAGTRLKSLVPSVGKPVEM